MSTHPAVQPCGHSHDHCQNKDLVEAAMDRARKAGLRRTKALRDVIHILAEARQPLTLADVVSSDRLESHADQATVYRLLLKLEERGILRRLGLRERSAYYAMVFPGAHSDYLICTQCGVIQRLDIRCPVEAIEAQVAEQSGFSQLYHELEFYGHCPTCTAS